MRKVPGSCALLLAGLWICAPGPAAAAQEAKPPSARELRTAMNRAEKRFFEVYNRVNVDKRHQMDCAADDMTGSRLKKGRSCKTRGESEVGEAAAREYLNNRELTDSLSAAAPGAADGAGPLGQVAPRTPAVAGYADGAMTDGEAKLQQERLAFDAHLRQLLDQHPELRQRFDEYLLARTRYEAAGK